MDSGFTFCIQIQDNFSGKWNEGEKLTRKHLHLVGIQIFTSVFKYCFVCGRLRAVYLNISIFFYRLHRAAVALVNKKIYNDEYLIILSWFECKIGKKSSKIISKHWFEYINDDIQVHFDIRLSDFFFVRTRFTKFYPCKWGWMVFFFWQ